MKRPLPRALLLIAVLLLAGCGQQKAGDAGQQSASGQPGMHWKMQSYWQSGTLPQTLFEEFAKRVTDLSGGRLAVEALATGAVVAPTESLDAVGSGVLDGHNGGPAYFTGKDAAFALLGDPQGAFETPYQFQMWMEYGGGNELARELYATYGVHFVGGVWYGQECLVSKRPLRSLADFKGLKIRAPQGMNGEIFTQLGAAPVQLPGSEVYTALERGVVDAADWGTLSMNDDLGYHKLAKYPTYPGFHSMPMGEISVNKAKWDALPADLKAIIESATYEFARAMIQRNYLADAKVAVERGQRGFEPTDMPLEERQKFREIARSVWKEYAARSPLAQKVHASQIAFLQQLGLLRE
ncbi:MAG TPA: TRAP transporter substrate-binding protein [Burkholderiales bacterium]|nr:TRAP transporter substrate-binding protein [Burkholderiales bacterium]